MPKKKTSRAVSKRAIPTVEIGSIIAIVIAVQILNAKSVDMDELVRTVETLFLIFGVKGGIAVWAKR